MNRAFFVQLWLLLFAFLFKGVFLPAIDTASPCILVSVAPHKLFVEKIAKGTVQVYLMVPAGASSHTYEPTPRQMITASKASLWFRIGESFENRAIQALKSHHPDLEIVDLRQGLDLISTDHAHGHRGCCPGSVDLHFWLSARQAQIQAQTIAEALIKAYPENTVFYSANLQIFQQELQDLDREIQLILGPLKNRHILVSHPAYGYFCRDYALEQYAIEIEGKDPTPFQLTKLLTLIRQLNLRTIFIQMQYNNKAAKLVADTLGAQLVILDPYSEHYFTSMLEIAHAFANE